MKQDKAMMLQIHYLQHYLNNVSHFSNHLAYYLALYIIRIQTAILQEQ